MALGKTLQQIEQMPERHLKEYELFYQEQPFGLWREDYRTAQIAHMLAMINKDPKSNGFEFSEFMPFFKPNKAEDENVEDMDDGSEAFLSNR